MIVIPFDSSDPFPLLTPGLASYRDEQIHSAAVDHWLELRTESVEAALTEKFDRDLANERDERHWIGLPTQSLLTPYTELRTILSRLSLNHETVVDLGAGYGRLGFVIARHFPSASFLGIEVVAERVREGSAALERFVAKTDSLGAISLIQDDLTREGFRLPEASIFFLYDYGSSSAIGKTLEDLRSLSMSGPITVVGRGGATRDAIEKKHPWLSQVRAPEHFPHFSIYRS